MALRQRALFFILILSLGCSGGATGEDSQIPEEKYRSPVKVMKITPADLVVTLSATGQVMSHGAVTVSALAGGTVTSLPVEIGDSIEKGSILACLDQADYKIALHQALAVKTKAEINLEQEKRNHTRALTLRDENLISDSEYEGMDLSYNMAIANLESAQAAIERAELDMERTRIISPISGEVAARFVEIGQSISIGTPIVHIERPDDLEILVWLSESEIWRVSPETPVKITLSAAESAKTQGKIKNIGIAPEPDLGSYPVIISIASEDHRVRPGMTARVLFSTALYLDSIAAPRNAVVDRMGEQGFYVVEGARVRFTPARFGIISGDNIQVTEGLEPGDQLVIFGQANLRDGQGVITSVQEP